MPEVILLTNPLIRGAVETPPMGFVTFESDDPHYAFTARLGDASPAPSGGYGGWSPVPRARNRALTEWNGNDPLQIDISVLFDNFAEGESIEADIRQLEKMAGLEANLREPPLVRFDSNGVIPHDAHDDSKLDWVIVNIDWGDSDRNVEGNRIRAAAVIHVMQYIQDTELRESSSATKRKRQSTSSKKQGAKPKGASNKTYTVKAGDTLSSIAARQLGSASRWHEIADKNGIRDPKSLQVGKPLKLP